MECDQFLEAVTDFKVGRDEFIGQFGAAADDLEVALVAHEPLDEIVVDPEHNHHIGVGTARFVNLVCIDDDEFPRHKLVLSAFQIDRGVSVQDKVKFQRVVPVGRCVIPGRPVLHQDAVLGDIVVLQIDIFGHIDSFRLFVPIYHFNPGSARSIRATIVFAVICIRENQRKSSEFFVTKMIFETFFVEI